MTALVPDPAWRAQVPGGGLVVHAGADLAYLLPDVPGAAAGVLVELVEPVRRGSARPLDPGRLTAPVRAHLPQLRSLGALRPAGLPVPDEPLNVGVRVLGTQPAGLGDHFPRHAAEADVVLVVRTSGTLRPGRVAGAEAAPAAAPGLPPHGLARSVRGAGRKRLPRLAGRARPAPVG